MGDRCLIQVKSGDELADCAVYLHWSGTEAVDMLKRAIPGMRADDTGYSTARLIGSLHGEIKGNYSLGVMPVVDSKDPAADSHGDAGVIVYDCGTGATTFHGGYLADQHPDGLTLPIPPA